MLKTFDEVFDDYTKYGTKIKTEQYHTVGTNIIIDQGQADIAGYTDQIDGLFKDVPVIVFGDHTRIIKYINRPFFLGADGTKILKSKIPDANYKYLYYALKNAKIPNTGYNRHFKWLKQISISYPELQKQSMIVEILDKLEDSIDNYNTILGLLDKLVKARFIEMFGDPVLNERKFPTLSGADFFKLSNGRAVPDEKRIEAGIPAYGGNGISWYTDEFLMAEDTIVVGRVGFQSGNVHYVIGPLWITDNAMYISQYDKDKFNLRFLYELMQHVNFSRFQDAGDLKKITQKPFMTFKYILPSMDLQQKFVNFKIEVDKSKYDDMYIRY